MKQKNSKVAEPTTNVDVLAAPRLVLEEAKARANRENKRRNLDLLWETLMDIRNEGCIDYSIAEVGRRLEQLGGPKTQSLRNTGGSDFREIISTFVSSVHGSSRHIPETKSRLDQALEWISDPTVKAILCLEIANAKKLKTENSNLRHAFSRLSAPVSTELSSEVEINSTEMLSVKINELLPSLSRLEGGRAESAFGDNHLPDDLIEALKIGVNPRRVQTLGFSTKEDGSITNARGDELFPPRFVTACEMIIEQFENSSNKAQSPR